MAILSSLWSWVSGKARLIIEYVLLALVVALAGYAVFSAFERKQLVANVNDLSSRLGTVSNTLNEQVELNKQQDVAISEISRLRSVDSEAIQGLQRDLSDANTKDQAVRQKLAQLEKNNADARALLDTAVPAALGCLLDGRACTGADSGNAHGVPAAGKATGGTSGALPASEAGAH